VASQALTLTSSTIGATMPLVNQGLLVIHGSNAINGVLTAAGGSMLRVEGTGTQGTGTLTVANGFTNNGLIELTNNSLNQSATLAVTSGTLANADSIHVLGGGGTRTLAAQLDNQATGTLAVDQALTISKAGAAHTNSGSIEVSGGDLALNQTGASPSFTTNGIVFVDVGRTWNVSGGAVDYIGGALGGYGTIALSNVTLGLAATITHDTLPAFLSVSLTNSTVNGQGTLAVAVSNTLTLVGTTVNVPLVNFGTVEARPGTNLLNGAVTNAPGALLRLNGNNGFADVTVANGFTNAGSIELTGTSWAGRLTVGSPTPAILLNAVGATLQTVGGSGNVLTAVLDNQGTVLVGGPLTLNAAAAGHNNSGLIKLSGGDLTVVESGFRPGIGNFGTIDVGTNKMVVSGTGSFLNQTGGILRGSGGTFDVATPNISFITNGRTIVDGSPGGVVNWVGTFTQGPDPSSLELDVAGLGANAGTDYDLLNVSDNVTLQGGTLQVTGALGSKQTYTIITVPAGKTITGDFQTKTGLGQCSSGVSGTAYVIVCP
jgi:hypothetical protein